MSENLSENLTVRTRFAPSPSGHLHVGGARTALFCWAFARGKGAGNGKFILRIEDTDQKRSSSAASDAFLEDLKWLGIDWDEGPEFEGCGGGEAGPYYQSERLDIYERYFAELLEAGKAYYAFETPAALAAKQQAARAANQNYRYDRAALALSADEVAARVAAGDRCVIRLKVDETAEIVIQDAVLGEATVPAGEIDDFVIRKADGFPTYHFAVVVDDETMGVTHVLRAQEHFKNTAKHLLIQDALGFRHPVYGHLPLLCNLDGSKMSKRDKDKALRKALREQGVTEVPPEVLGADAEFAAWLGAKDRQLEFGDALKLAEFLGVTLPEINVEDFKRSGYLPEVLCNFLALNGWSPGGDVEKFDREFLVANFDLGRVLKAPAKFDRAKLLSFNLDALQALDAAEFAARLRAHAAEYRPEYLAKLSPEQFALFAQVSQPRSKTLAGPFVDGKFFIMADAEIVLEKSKGVRKGLQNGEPNGYAHLEAVLPMLMGVHDWKAATLEVVVSGYAENYAEGKLGKVAQPLRIAVSGGAISPAIFETLEILGKDSVLQRVRQCLATRGQQQKTPGDCV